LAAFFRQIEFLEEKAGPVLIQLPPSLEFDRVRANTFLSQLRERYGGDVVWEPRHLTWFDSEADGLLKSFGIARVAADPACTHGAAEPGGATNLVYFRLHGSPRIYYSLYDSDYIEQLSVRLKNLSSASSGWCIFDNTASGAATQNALELRDRVATAHRSDLSRER
jgi:uncharacterized protein YecE (DUF72 family)